MTYLSTNRMQLLQTRPNSYKHDVFHTNETKMFTFWTYFNKQGKTMCTYGHAELHFHDTDTLH